MPNSAATQDSLRILSQYNISKWFNKPESAVARMTNVPDPASALCWESAKVIRARDVIYFERAQRGALPMSRWETASTLQADVPPSEIWESAYEDAQAWPSWNAEIASARLDGPLALGATARIAFRTACVCASTSSSMSAAACSQTRLACPARAWATVISWSVARPVGVFSPTPSTSKVGSLRSGGASSARQPHARCRTHSEPSLRSRAAERRVMMR